jgi:RNA polymerase sigma-70 factor (ECF subfamily)
MEKFASPAADPEQQASNSEIRGLLEEAVEALPEAYRTIFILRDVEEMSTSDAAYALEISEENVKVRLHRARALLRKSLYARAGMQTKEAFSFHAVRCDRVVKNVFERIRKRGSNTDSSAPKIQ